MAGRADEFKGSVKETAGNLTGNEQWQAEGKAQQLEGKSEREAAGAKNEGVGSLKKGVGKLTGNEQMETEGEAQKLEGKTQRMG